MPSFNRSGTQGKYKMKNFGTLPSIMKVKINRDCFRIENIKFQIRLNQPEIKSWFFGGIIISIKWENTEHFKLEHKFRIFRGSHNNKNIANLDIKNNWIKTYST